MLPDGVRPIYEIEREPYVGNRIANFCSLLGYLLKLHKPDVKLADGKEPGLSERVKLNFDLFSENQIQNILFSIAVRNYLIHPEGQLKSFSTTEKSRACEHLRRAVNLVISQPTIPANIRNEIQSQPTTEISNHYPDKASTPNRNSKPIIAPPTSPSNAGSAQSNPNKSEQPTSSGTTAVFIIIIGAGLLWFTSKINTKTNHVSPPPHSSTILDMFPT